MPEERPTPPAHLMDQARDRDLSRSERQAAQADLDSWYRQNYPEPKIQGPPAAVAALDRARATGALLNLSKQARTDPVAARQHDLLYAQAYPPDPTVPHRPRDDGVPVDPAAYVLPPELSTQLPDRELGDAIRGAAGMVGMSHDDFGAVVTRYQKLASGAETPPTPEKALDALTRWHGEGRAQEILGAARKAVAEAIALDPRLEEHFGVLGLDPFAITTIGLAALGRRRTPP